MVITHGSTVCQRRCSKVKVTRRFLSIYRHRGTSMSVTHGGKWWRTGPVLCLYLGRLVGIWRLSCWELGRLDDAFHMLIDLCKDTERRHTLALREVREERVLPTWVAAHLACRWEVSCRCWFRCLEKRLTFGFWLIENLDYGVSKYAFPWKLFK